MKWITRKDIKVDRVACPWLIKRFVDPQADFLFVEEEDLRNGIVLRQTIAEKVDQLLAVREGKNRIENPPLRQAMLNDKSVVHVVVREQNGWKRRVGHGGRMFSQTVRG